MGLGVSLITFSPNTIIRSADVNSNFSGLNNTTSFSGTITSTTGSTLRGISYFSGTGSGLFNHGQTAGPTAFGIQYAGNFGTQPTAQIVWFGVTSSQVNIVAQATYFWQAAAFTQ